MDCKLVALDSEARQAKHEATINKIISGILIQHIKRHTYPISRYLPLCAYLPHRGIVEPLLRVSRDCRVFRTRCQKYQNDSISDN